MTAKRAAEIMRNELACVMRASGPGIVCDRNCRLCDLVMDDAELKDAIGMAVVILEERAREEESMRSENNRMTQWMGLHRRS